MATATRKKRGRKPAGEIGILIAHALKNIEELEILEECPLAGLMPVRRLAETKYSDSLFPTGLAIRNLLLEAIETVCSDLGELPGYKRECQLLKSVASGNSVAEFSRGLGLSREHVARTVQQRALKLLNRVFLAQARETG